MVLTLLAIAGFCLVFALLAVLFGAIALIIKVGVLAIPLIIVYWIVKKFVIKRGDQ